MYEKWKILDQHLLLCAVDENFRNKGVAKNEVDVIEMAEIILSGQLKKK